MDIYLNHMIQNPEKYIKPSLQIADCRLKIADLKIAKYNEISHYQAINI